MSSLGPSQGYPHANLDAPAVLLTCKPGVVAEGVAHGSSASEASLGSRSAPGQPFTRVVVLEDVVAVGQEEGSVEPRAELE